MGKACCGGGLRLSGSTTSVQIGTMRLLRLGLNSLGELFQPRDHIAGHSSQTPKPRNPFKLRSSAGGAEFAGFSLGRCFSACQITSPQIACFLIGIFCPWLRNCKVLAGKVKAHWVRPGFKCFAVLFVTHVVPLSLKICHGLRLKFAACDAVHLA